MVLGVVAQLDLMAPLNFAFVGEGFRQNFNEGRLALAVLADERDFLAAHKLQIESAQNVLGAVVLVDSVQARHDFARVGCGRKLKAHLPRVLVVDLDDFDSVQLLDEGLRKRGLARLGAEPVDQLLGMLDFLVLVGLGLALLLANFFAKREVLEVGHVVVVALAEHNLEGAVGRVVQEGAVVRHQNDGLVALGQEFFEPQNRLDVEVVRRFVEQEHVVVLKQNFGEFDAHLPSARKRIQRLVKVGRFKAKAQEHALQVGLVGVAADVLKPLLRVVKAVQKLHVGVAFVVGAGAHFGGHRFDVGLEALDFGEARGGLVPHAGRGRRGHVLRQKSDAEVARVAYFARIRSVAARN